MSSEDKEAMGLAGHLRVAASSFTTLLRTQTQRAAIDVALLAIRELCWDDHNECEGRGAGRVLCVWVTQEQIQATTKLLGVKAAYVCALICRFLFLMATAVNAQWLVRQLLFLLTHSPHTI